MSFLRRLFRRNKVAETASAQTQDLASRLHCEHGPENKPFELIILGSVQQFYKSPLCIACTRAYMDKYATYCAYCDKPILPGMKVGITGEGDKYPFAHLNCCDSLAFFCGEWGEGRLVTLHELAPDKYPEGTGSVLFHTLDTGQTSIVNV